MLYIFQKDTGVRRNATQHVQLQRLKEEGCSVNVIIALYLDISVIQSHQNNLKCYSVPRIT